ncbi:unnamed protein product [Lampetra fluviatilis]
MLRCAAFAMHPSNMKRAGDTERGPYGHAESQGHVLVAKSKPACDERAWPSVTIVPEKEEAEARDAAADSRCSGDGRDEWSLVQQRLRAEIEDDTAHGGTPTTTV